MEHNKEFEIKLFISRNLNQDSLFHNLKLKGWEIIDRSFLHITYLQIDRIPETDWIFFYSSHGVKAFAENVKALDFDLKGIKIAAYGEATARIIKNMNWPLDFTGTGEANSTAEKFKPFLQNHKVLFPIAKHSHHALKPLISNQAETMSLTVYENQLAPDIQIPDCHYYLFSSGRNVESFFRKNHIPEYAKVLAIGPTTAQKLEKYYTGNIHLPELSTEESLFQLVNHLS